MSFWSRLSNALRPGRLDRDLDEEQQFHIEERIRERIAAGLAPGDAAAEVTRRFGSRLRLREESRDARLLTRLESLIRDVRLGGRTLRRQTGVTVAAVLSLALALGASVAAFSLINALVLRPLPVRAPDELVSLAFPTYTTERPESETFSDPMFVHLRQTSTAHVDLIAMSTHVMRPAAFDNDPTDTERVRTQYVSGEAFALLGVAPAIGRLLAPDDDRRPGGQAVAVVSHAFWMRRFGGDPAAVGRTFALEGRPFQIVGVAEPRFGGVEPGRPTDLWVPYATYSTPAFGNFQQTWFRILGRLKGGSTLAQAHAELEAAFMGLRRERARFADKRQSPEAVKRFAETPLYVRSAATGPSSVRRQFGRPLWILACIALLVLVIAGSNVANLFLARAAARAREMSLRASIGASRGRLIQQALVESALVACAACALGFLFAAVAAPAVVGMLTSSDDPVRLDLGIDWRIAAFAAAMAVVVTALFGLPPAMRASRAAPVASLTSGGPRTAAGTVAMRPFVVVQVAFSLTVLFVGGLLVLSFAKISTVDPGFATSEVLLVDLASDRRVEPAVQRAAFLQVLDRLRAIPDVDSVSSAQFNQIGRAWTHHVRIPGTERDAVEATMSPVLPGYFETMRIPLVAGRTFERRDLDSPGSPAVVVNESFARRFFGGVPAVGRTFDGRFDDNVPRHEVIGVVADTRYDLREPPAPMIYVLEPPRSAGTIHLRAAGDPLALAPAVRDAIAATTPLFRVSSIRPQSDVIDGTLLRERLLALLSGFFAAVGLVLAAVGLYGLLSYAVVRRTREIGIRVALGATRTRVMRTLAGEAGLAVALGVVAGLGGGLYLSRFVQSLLFEVAAFEFWSLALPIGTLLGAAAIAAVLPALRAARVDPVIALKDE
jgi:predicted permease